MNNQGNINSHGRLERLEAQVQELLQESKEPYFTEYLHKMKERMINQKYQVDLLQDELERNYRLYLKRKGIDQVPGEQEIGQAPREQEIEQALGEQEINQAPGEHIHTAQNAVVYAPYYPQQPTRPAKNNREFTIGAVVFSAIGVTFILVSFIMLGMNFMNGFIKGMSLYAINLGILLFSELFLYKKSSGMGTALSAIGIGGLYLSTVINYAQWGNFNGVVAVMITTVITAGTLLISWKKDSWLLRMLGLIVSYLCLFSFTGNHYEHEVIIITITLCFVNVMSMFLPVRKAQIAIGNAHILISTFLNLIFLIRFSWNIYGSDGYQTIFLLTTFVVLQLIYLRMLHAGNKMQERGERFDRQSVTIAYCISASFYIIAIGFFVNNFMAHLTWLKHVNIAAILLICLGVFFLLRKEQERWIPYFIANIVIFLGYAFSNNKLESVICILVIFALSKMLTKVHMLYISEAIIMVITCFYTLINSDGPYVYILGIAILMSILFLHRWQTYYEIVITYTMVLLASLKLSYQLRLPVIMGILFVATLIFHNVKRWKGKRISIFNISVLIGQFLCYVSLMHRSYKGEYLTYIMMLVFGLATIIITFQKKYDMDFKKKELIMSVFLTYMVFISRTGIPILTSILLMIIALICIGVGFRIKDKGIRIYGLLLSLFVCIKVALYDFWSAFVVQRMILFFVVGVIALAISGIYIVLEKKYIVANEKE